MPKPSAAIIIIIVIIIIIFIIIVGIIIMKKMKQRANFCGKKSPLHAVVWCWSFWMVVRLNCFTCNNQPSLPPSPLLGPYVQWNAWDKKNAWWPAMEKCGLCSNTHDIEIVFIWCLGNAWACNSVLCPSDWFLSFFWTNWQPLTTQPQFIYKKRGFRVCSCNLRRVQQHDSVDTLQWSHPVLNQQTSRKRPYAFFFVTQWYHATNASHGAVCQFSKYGDGLKLRMLGPALLKNAAAGTNLKKQLVKCQFHPFSTTYYASLFFFMIVRR